MEKTYRNIGLNPFMNQVSFYTYTSSTMCTPHCRSLNPFMNQVSFYLLLANYIRGLGNVS